MMQAYELQISLINKLLDLTPPPPQNKKEKDHNPLGFDFRPIHCWDNGKVIRPFQHGIPLTTEAIRSSPLLTTRG